MTGPTPLDTAHAAMDAAPEDDRARLRFYDRLAEAELVLLLDAEASGDRIEPTLFDTGDGRFVLAFDLEERMGAFIGGPAPYAALSGRALAAMLAGQGIGIALNPDVAPSAILIPAAAVDWLADTLGRRPAEITARPTEIARPDGLPDALLQALEAKLALAAGLASAAVLARAGYEGGGTGHLLAFLDARPGAEPALAQAVSEALTFSGLEAGALDVTFLAGTDPAAERLLRHGLRIALPAPPEPARPSAPGMDPDRPPKLR